ncbi:MAG: SO_0444 family Cu/Zn efflux transporter [Pirellulales bacterium]
MSQIGTSFVELWLEAAPWLIIGLAIAGAMRAFLPAHLIAGWLGGRGLRPVVRAAIIGAPLPLCSCSVLPAAVTLHRHGASRGATVSFLVATPENGVDSMLLSYALLGPALTALRLVGATVGSIFAGLLTDWWGTPESEAGQTAPPSPTGSAGPTAANLPLGQRTDPWWLRLRQGEYFAFTKLLGDLIGWLVLGVAMAAIIQTLAPKDWLAEVGSHPIAKLIMLLVGIPMYVCASASTPLAAGLLASGVSPGTVLVLLLAGPATNLGSIAVVRREIGTRSVVAYLAGITVASLGTGLLVDWLWPGWQPLAGHAHHHHGEHIPPVLTYLAALVLAAAALVKLGTWLRDVTMHGQSHEHGHGHGHGHGHSTGASPAQPPNLVQLEIKPRSGP